MTAYHGNMVKVVDEENGAQLLGLEGARQLHEQVHAGIPHAVQVVVQLPILRPKIYVAHIALLLCHGAIYYSADVAQYDLSAFFRFTEHLQRGCASREVVPVERLCQQRGYASREVVPAVRLCQ